MNTIPLDQTGKNLSIDITCFRRNSKGQFVIPADTIRTHDLSALPSSTGIEIDWRGSHRRSASDLICIRSLLVIDDAAIRVEANHHRCSCCWGHTLDYKKYSLIADDLFTVAATELNNLRYNGIEQDKGGNIWHLLVLEVTNSTFEEIEEQVTDCVMAVLQPLLDCRDSLDAMTLKKFGLKEDSEYDVRNLRSIRINSNN